MRPLFAVSVLSVLPAVVALGVAASATRLSAQAAPSGDVPDSVYAREHYVKRELRVPMRDGARLFTSVYVPKDASPARRYPVVLLRTPFSVAPYGPDTYPRTLGPDRFMMREGYVFAYQDVRGRYMSDGSFENVRPLLPDSVKARDPRAVDEATDTYDTIDWLLSHVPEAAPRVGQWGISYPGFYASVGALSRHPALVASSPQAPVTDIFFEDFHHNGALTQAFWAAFPVFGVRRTEPTTRHWWLPEYLKVSGAMPDSADDYAFQLSLGPLKTLTERFYGDNVLWRDVVAHPNYDAFWRARAVPPALRGVTHAVLVVGGWFDAENLYGPLAVYRALREQDPQATTTLVMGPWSHRAWAAGDVVHSTHGDLYFGDSLETRFQRDVEAPFFRAHLKGDGRAGLPGALTFDTGRRRWERFDRWPAPAATTRDYWFRADGSLSTRAPTEARAFREYSSDPLHPAPARCTGPTIEDGTLNRYMSDDQRCFDARPDVLVFRTEPLAHDVTLGGEIAARLRVSTTGTDADFVVKLIDVYPPDFVDDPARPDTSVHLAGYEQLVRGEIMRGRFRRSFATPEPFRPGEVTAVDFRLQDVLHTFRRGHRIMVQVQSSWFPAFDRNPQTFVPNVYEADASDFVAATHRLWLDRDHPSGIRVRVLP